MATKILTGCLPFDLLLVVILALIAVLIYFKHSYQYWKNKGVPYLEPTFPYGNSLYLFPKCPIFSGETKVWYDELKAQGHKFGGVWSLSRKVLVLVDPDYIKHVLTQDFSHFTDRDFYVNERDDPLGTHLVNIREPNWKPLRQNLTPAFTSGKIKIIFETMINCSDAMVDYMKKYADNQKDIEIREVLASYTTDVIGSVAFGVECNSFDKSQCEFRNQGKDLFVAGPYDYFRMLMGTCFPDLARAIGIKGGKMKPRIFFKNILKKNIAYRMKNCIKRKDFLQIFMDINEEANDTNKFTFDQVVANTVMFFIAGFDTSSTAMTFTLFELAKNPDIQERARQKINEVLAKHNGQITYEAIKEITYLRQILNEAMRLYPSVVTLGRICTKDYQLRNTNTVIEKGTPVVISTLGLGRDREYYPNPEQFDPERFSPEEKAKRHPYVHIPFGEGPRNCIGKSLGMLLSKLGLIKVLTNFRLSVSPKTKLPLELDPKLFLLKETSTLYLLAEKI